MNKTILVIFLLFSVFSKAQKTKAERQAELDARKRETTTKRIKANELAKDVEILYITLYLANKPLSLSGKRAAGIETGNGKVKGLKGETGFLYFNSDTHAINYIASFGWELLNHQVQTTESSTSDKYIFKKLSNGTLPPLVD